MLSDTFFVRRKANNFIFFYNQVFPDKNNRVKLKDIVFNSSSHKIFSNHIFWGESCFNLFLSIKTKKYY
jgi:hypothetical protein